MTGKVRILGSGGSMGVPIIGCHCTVCQSKSPYNQRLRSSILLTISGKHYVVDVGPDYRTQALKYGIDTLDGVLLTHTHYDHVAGLDELRIYAYRQGHAIPCLVSEETREELKVRFHYIFTAKQPFIRLQSVQGEKGNTQFEGVDIHYFSYRQMGMGVTGFRIEKFAYVTDIADYDESIFNTLKGIETLVIGVRGWTPSPAHLSVEEVIQFARSAGAKRIYLTHVSHEIEHAATSDKLPEGFMLAYDGMEILL